MLFRSDVAVQQMVEESVEHAFEDMAARRWIEAKLKAQEIISATRKGLAESGNELEADCKTKIEIALSEVEGFLSAENPETHGGDLRQLQSATAALDEATKPLADLMMDKAMEAMLRKRGMIK